MRDKAKMQKEGAKKTQEDAAKMKEDIEAASESLREYAAQANKDADYAKVEVFLHSPMYALFQDALSSAAKADNTAKQARDAVYEALKEVKAIIDKLGMLSLLFIHKLLPNRHNRGRI